MTTLPHDNYIDAVLAALTAADLAPDDAFTQAADGEQLEAVMTWDGANPRFDSEQWPHGVLVCWSQNDSWEYAARNADQSNQTPRELVHEWTPAPESVVDAVRVLLSGPDGLPIDGHAWDLKAELVTALRVWDEDDES